MDVGDIQAEKEAEKKRLRRLKAKNSRSFRVYFRICLNLQIRKQKKNASSRQLQRHFLKPSTTTFTSLLQFR